jgi:hypothetical protein
MSMTPLCISQRCNFFQIFSWIIRHSFIRKSDSAAHSAAVSMTLLCKYDTVVQIWHRCDFGPHIRAALAKGIPIKKTYTGKLSCTITITFTQKIWGWPKLLISLSIFFANWKPYSKRGLGGVYGIYKKKARGRKSKSWSLGWADFEITMGI